MTRWHTYACVHRPLYMYFTQYFLRGAVEIWKPKVTPMSDLRPQELRQIKTAIGDTVTAAQKTSLQRDGPQVQSV